MSTASGPQPTPDPRWPRASQWLAEGPGTRSVDVAVLGVPAFATSLSPTGAHATPQAVRRALTRLSTWCASRRIELADPELGIAPLDLGDVQDPDLDEGDWRTRTAAGSGAQRAKLVFAIGGDNSITAQVMQGVMADELGGAGLVTLDAHHDIREGRSNGTPVRELIDAGLDPEHVVQVGIADWANSKSYGDEAHARGVHVVPVTVVTDGGIQRAMAQALDVAGAGGAPVYVDLDADVCDRAVAPACPASLPGGLSARDFLTAAFLAGRDPRVRAVDITEIDARADAPDGRTVRLAAMALLEVCAGLALRPEQ
ncbi:MAG: arginase family protein [Actinomycetes bacterium]